MPASYFWPQYSFVFWGPHYQHGISHSLSNQAHKCNPMTVPSCSHLCPHVQILLWWLLPIFGLSTPFLVHFISMASAILCLTKLTSVTPWPFFQVPIYVLTSDARSDLTVTYSWKHCPGCALEFKYASRITLFGYCYVKEQIYLPFVKSGIINI